MDLHNHKALITEEVLDEAEKHKGMVGLTKNAVVRFVAAHYAEVASDACPFATAKALIAAHGDELLRVSLARIASLNEARKFLVNAATWKKPTKEHNAKFWDVFTRCSMSRRPDIPREELEQMSRGELVVLLLEMGLPRTGNKRDLVERLCGKVEIPSNPGAAVECFIRDWLSIITLRPFVPYSNAKGSSHPPIPSGMPGITGGLLPDAICTAPICAPIALRSPLYPGRVFHIPRSLDGMLVEVKVQILTEGTAHEKIPGVKHKYALAHEMTGMPVIVVVSGIAEHFVHTMGAFGVCTDTTCHCHSNIGKIRTTIWDETYGSGDRHVYFIPASAMHCIPL